MTQDDLRTHLDNRARTAAGTIARGDCENLNGQKGKQIVDVQPMAVAFFKAAHEQPCSCRYCTAG
jgi:hypothetical protein